MNFDSIPENALVMIEYLLSSIDRETHKQDYEFVNGITCFRCLKSHEMMRLMALTLEWDFWGQYTYLSDDQLEQLHLDHIKNGGFHE